MDTYTLHHFSLFSLFRLPHGCSLMRHICVAVFIKRKAKVIWLYSLGATWVATSEPRLFTVTVSHPWAGERPISPACSHITVTDVRAFPPGPLRSQNSLNRHCCWQSATQRDGEKSYCQISTVEVTASPHLCCEFKVKIDSSPYVAIYSFYQPMTFIVTNKGIVSSTALDGSLHWVTRFHSGGT